VVLCLAGVLCIQGSISPAMAGLCLLYALDTTRYLKFGTQMASQTESNFNSVERIVQVGAGGRWRALLPAHAVRVWLCLLSGRRRRSHNACALLGGRWAGAGPEMLAALLGSRPHVSAKAQEAASPPPPNTHPPPTFPQYLKPEQEADDETRPEVEAKLPKEWPNAGAIVASKMAMRYRIDTPLVLKSGCGVAGRRQGAGCCAAAGWLAAVRVAPSPRQGRRLKRGGGE
jgi:hypothetical protein